jgi:3-hydroxymyristoyl/3-hydroxydecanoyl-(acyl carrier protein) dehydratase
MRLRFVDRILLLAPKERASAQKCVSFEEAMLPRPGLGRGVPATLLIEWAGQVAALLVAESTDYQQLAVLGNIETCSFGPLLVPGDLAQIEVKVRAWREDSALFDATITTNHRREHLRFSRALMAFVSLTTLIDQAELRAAVRAAKGEFPGPVGWR